jgi:hypothetical protein
MRRTRGHGRRQEDEEEEEAFFPDTSKQGQDVPSYGVRGRAHHRLRQNSLERTAREERRAGSLSFRQRFAARGAAADCRPHPGVKACSFCFSSLLLKMFYAWNKHCYISDRRRLLSVCDRRILGKDSFLGALAIVPSPPISTSSHTVNAPVPFGL